ncbi:MAG: hypothetical protein ACXVB9_13185 [Bdellovibrionota bacterium]
MKTLVVLPCLFFALTAHAQGPSPLATAPIDFGHAWDSYGAEEKKAEQNIQLCDAAPAAAILKLRDRSNTLKAAIDRSSADLVSTQAEMSSSDPAVIAEMTRKVDMDKGAQESQARMLEEKAEKLMTPYEKANISRGQMAQVSTDLLDLLVINAKLRNEKQSGCRNYKGWMADFASTGKKNALSRIVEIQTNIVAAIKSQHDALTSGAVKIRSSLR